MLGRIGPFLIPILLPVLLPLAAHASKVETITFNAADFTETVQSIRLTNWDVQRLSAMLTRGVPVNFIEKPNMLFVAYWRMIRKSGHGFSLATYAKRLRRDHA